MSASVRISLKCAESLFATSSAEASDELCQAIKKARRSLSRKAAVKKSKTSKRKCKALETAALREVIQARGGFRCEVCGYASPLLEMDHFFGRGKEEQSVENCWMLCQGCHVLKTQNHPTAVVWLDKFIMHCLKYGYESEIKNAKAKRGIAVFKVGAK